MALSAHVCQAPWEGALSPVPGLAVRARSEDTQCFWSLISKNLLCSQQEAMNRISTLLPELEAFNKILFFCLLRGGQIFQSSTHFLVRWEMQHIEPQEQNKNVRSQATFRLCFKTSAEVTKRRVPSFVCNIIYKERCNIFLVTANRFQTRTCHAVPKNAQLCIWTTAQAQQYS